MQAKSISASLRVGFILDRITVAIRPLHSLTPPQLAKEMSHVRTSTYTVNLTRLSTVENSLYYSESPSCQSSGADDSPQMFSGFSRLIPQCRGCSGST